MRTVVWTLLASLAACGASVEDRVAAVAASDAAVRIGAVRALAETGPAAAAAVPALRLALADPVLTDLAVWALGEIGQADAATRAALRALSVEAQPLRHAVLCVALGRLGGGEPEVVADLERWSSSPHAIVRQAARGALRRLRR